jgi:hypothetical protein
MTNRQCRSCHFYDVIGQICRSASSNPDKWLPFHEEEWSRNGGSFCYLHQDNTWFHCLDATSLVLPYLYRGYTYRAYNGTDNYTLNYPNHYLRRENNVGLILADLDKYHGTGFMIAKSGLDIKDITIDLSMENVSGVTSSGDYGLMIYRKSSTILSPAPYYQVMLSTRWSYGEPLGWMLYLRSNDGSAIPDTMMLPGYKYRLYLQSDGSNVKVRGVPLDGGFIGSTLSEGLTVSVWASSSPNEGMTTLAFWLPTTSANVLTIYEWTVCNDALLSESVISPYYGACGSYKRFKP